MNMRQIDEEVAETAMHQAEAVKGLAKLLALINCARRKGGNSTRLFPASRLPWFWSFEDTASTEDSNDQDEAEELTDDQNEDGSLEVIDEDGQNGNETMTIGNGNETLIEEEDDNVSNLLREILVNSAGASRGLGRIAGDSNVITLPDRAESIENLLDEGQLVEEPSAIVIPSPSDFQNSNEDISSTDVGENSTSVPTTAEEVMTTNVTSSEDDVIISTRNDSMTTEEVTTTTEAIGGGENATQIASNASLSDDDEEGATVNASGASSRGGRTRQSGRRRAFTSNIRLKMRRASRRRRRRMRARRVSNRAATGPSSSESETPTRALTMSQRRKRWLAGVLRRMAAAAEANSTALASRMLVVVATLDVPEWASDE